MPGLCLPLLFLLLAPAQISTERSTAAPEKTPRSTFAPQAPQAPKHQATKPPSEQEQAAKIIQEGKNTPANLRRALALYRKVLSRKNPPAGGLSKKQRAVILTDMARAQLRLGDLSDQKKTKLRCYERGRDLAQRAQQFDPTLANAHFWEAANLAVIGRTNGITSSLFMISDLKDKLYKTQKLEPGHLLAKETIASIYAAVPGLFGGDDDKAESLYREILKSDAHFTSTKLTYAKFLIERSEKKRARVLLQEILREKKPSRPHDWRKFSRPEARKTLSGLQ